MTKWAEARIKELLVDYEFPSFETGKLKIKEVKKVDYCQSDLLVAELNMRMVRDLHRRNFKMRTHDANGPVLQ